MRLIGRRLPDLLIGILIVVLALGLGSLLLTQRNRAATLPSELPAPTTTSTATIPAAPGTPVAEAVPAPAVTPPDSTAPTPPADTTSSAAQNGGQPSAGATSSAPSTTTQPTTALPSAETPAAQPSPAASTPQTPPAPVAGGAVPTGNVQAPVTPQPDTAAPPVPSAAPAPTTPTTTSSAAPPATASAPAPTPRSGGAVATSENRTPLKRDYRISLGTFGSEAEAQTSSKAVQALGYTVYPIDVGSQVVAQVGPFADAQSAAAALSDIQRVYGGALVYAPRQSATSRSEPTSRTESTSQAASSATTPGTSTATSSAAPQAAPKPAPSSPPRATPVAAAPSGPVYLQVGAFDRQDSAQRLVGMLGDLGYSPSVQAPEGQKVRVLIGPFSGDAVVQAETKLNDNGFDHFRVR